MQFGSRAGELGEYPQLQNIVNLHGFSSKSFYTELTISRWLYYYTSSFFYHSFTKTKEIFLYKKVTYFLNLNKGEKRKGSPKTH